MNDMNNNQMAKREVVKIKCKFIGHRDGYGFAKPLDLAAEIPDFFIPPNCVHGAINNDIVLVKSKKDASKEFSSEGEICEIVERGNAFIVGVISYFQGKTFVEPDDKKFGKKFEVEKMALFARPETELLQLLFILKTNLQIQPEFCLKILGNLTILNRFRWELLENTIFLKVFHKK
ncbi:MAG: hypothetical protein RR400_01640 [Clostridia bacterium]